MVFQFYLRIILSVVPNNARKTTFHFYADNLYSDIPILKI